MKIATWLKGMSGVFIVLPWPELVSIAFNRESGLASLSAVSEQMAAGSEDIAVSVSEMATIAEESLLKP
ncbi:hypothetical protein ACFFSY_03565 [Paenibacillus aurantiacus]|uniref:Uncharacterized protein n=1 Tax=Paenibacillus aurantiacus TaxID=1936118 RepID=A0ABV5KID2_9BACL